MYACKNRHFTFSVAALLLLATCCCSKPLTHNQLSHQNILGNHKESFKTWKAHRGVKMPP